MIHESLPSPASRVQPDAAQVLREIESFAAFDRWMDEQLEILVARWIHTAAPNARHAFRASRDRG